MTFLAWLGRFQESAVCLEKVSMHGREFWHLLVLVAADVGAEKPVGFRFDCSARTLPQLGVELARQVEAAEVAMEEVRTDCARAE